MKNTALSFFFFLLPLQILAQYDLEFFLKPDSSFTNKPTPSLGLNSRAAVINSTETIGITKLYGGLSFSEKRHYVGIAYHWVNLDPSVQFVNFDQNKSTPILNWDNYLTKDLHMYTLQYKHFFINNYRWRFGIPIDIGMGRETSEVTKFYKDIKLSRESYFVPLITGAYLEYKAFRHFGGSVEFGYRQVLAQKAMVNNLNGIYFDFGLKIYFSTIKKDANEFFRNFILEN